jgi:hypothetical protein
MKFKSIKCEIYNFKWIESEIKFNLKLNWNELNLNELTLNELTLNELTLNELN